MTFSHGAEPVHSIHQTIPKTIHENSIHILGLERRVFLLRLFFLPFCRFRPFLSYPILWTGLSFARVSELSWQATEKVCESQIIRKETDWIAIII